MRTLPLTLAILSGCPKATPYTAALQDARYPVPSEVVDDLLSLTPDTDGVQWDGEGRVLVTTWSRAQFYPADTYTPGYAFTLYGETWFTAATQVADACQGLGGEDLALRVEQLLGLPVGGGRDVFVQVWIDPDDLRRPCAEPDITATSCPVAAPLAPGDGDSVSWACAGAQGHALWMCNTWVERYGASSEDQQYPWTALGYTYDWGQPDDPVGASEFVAPAGATVVLEAVVPNGEFCREP